MSNILKFPSTLEFLSPDAKAMRRHKDNANDHVINATVAYNDTAYLPPLQRKVESSNNALNVTQFMFPLSVQSISLDLESKVSQLRSLLDELANPASEQERQDILEDINTLLAAALVKTKVEFQKLSSSISPLLEGFDRTPTSGYLLGHKNDIERLSKDIEQANNTLGELVEQRKTITDAIGAIEKIGFEKIAMDTLLTVEGLDAIDAAAPQVAAVKLAIESTKKFIEHIGSVMNYLGLTAARDVIVKRINEQQTIMGTKNNEIRLTKLRISFIDAIHGFDDSCQAYFGELSKVTDALDLFVRANTSMTASDLDSVTKFIGDAQQMSAYLKAIQ
ncbi:hypothetical protein M2401_004797 [Pseudomonas sp. JUb42]|jgi:hypothetical protein|uniref:alpha-xenorhabdolysin family binary toxin subunit B n=1 Tax=Pseudomonas sp. JUb42 TaxID=2940611 RepID=UPI002169EAB5|nr:alpha-xenorhabdolysin family binary toxin subunit B [Pseudomonas sp. JUb42]MCS3471036.1 hypothetical protein [Pseudomonas sp. JUb42]